MEVKETLIIKPIETVEGSNLPSNVNIRDECLKKLENEKQQSLIQDETNTIIVFGTKSGGKTTLINSLTKKCERIEPTVGIDFSFVNARTLDMAVHKCNIWEIGGDPVLNSSLFKTPFKSCPSIPRTSVFIVVDLTQPELIWDVIVESLTKIKTIINKKLDKSKDHLRNKAIQMLEARKVEIFTLGNGNPEKMEKHCSSDHLPIPCLIFGTKYDIFEKLDIEKKRRICTILRLLANHFGTSLIFYSCHNGNLKQTASNLFNYFAFNKKWTTATAESENTIIKTDEPLRIIFGNDSYIKIAPNIPLEKFTLNNLKQLYQKKILDNMNTKSETTSLPKLITSLEINNMLDGFKEFEIDRAYELAMATLNRRQRSKSRSSSEDESPERNRNSRRSKENKGSGVGVGYNEQFIFDEVQDILEEGSHAQCLGGLF